MYSATLYYRPQTKCAKVMFLHLSVSHSVHRGGVCIVTGGAYVVGGHAWLGGMRGCGGACMVGGGNAWLWGACVVAAGCGCGRHAWLWRGGMCGCGGVCVVVGGMHGCGGGAVCSWGVCVLAGGCMGYNEIQSMSGRYTSYWNAFLLLLQQSFVHFPLFHHFHLKLKKYIIA